MNEHICHYGNQIIEGILNLDVSERERYFETSINTLPDEIKDLIVNYVYDRINHPFTIQVSLLDKNFKVKYVK